MQLNARIGTALVGLLGASGAVHAADWIVEGAFLSYQESDSQGQDRISVLEPVFTLRKEYGVNDYRAFTFIYDALTGASPNGAHASSRAQTFPGYTVPAGRTPLDPSFEDDRFVLQYVRRAPITDTRRYQYGVDLSLESDYSSIAGNFLYEKDINKRRTTLSFSLAASYDTVNPNGGFHDELSPIATTATSGGGEGFFRGREKVTFGLLAGVTHVLNRLTVLGLTYSLRGQNGYLTDPYKLVPVVDAAGFPVDYRWEKRPSSRLMHTLMGELVTAIGRDSAHFSYRYFFDDWGIDTHTIDAKYHFEFLNGWYLVPHYRLSIQGAADFYVLSLDQGAPLPAHASSDYRLADMTTTTYGLTLGYRLYEDAEVYASYEQVRQSGDSTPPEARGDQRLNDMFPEVRADKVIIGFRMKW